MKKRIIFNEIAERLEKKHIILILGARQTGKTTLMQQLHQQLQENNQLSFYLTLEDTEVIKMFDQNPENLFYYLPPLNDNIRYYVFIDEIQYLKDPSNFLKYLYDKYNENIKLIVSGSSGFYIDKKFKDSLAGRKRIFYLPTLSFDEFVAFKDRHDMLPFINSGKMPLIYKDELNKLMHEYITFGSYPELVVEPDIKYKKEILNEIANSYIKKDLEEYNTQTPELYYRLLQIFARQTGNLLNINTLANLFQKSNATIEKHISMMKKSFHVAEILPFYSNTMKELKKMPKLYFTDLGLRNYFVNDFSPILTRKDRGELFENFVFRRFYDKYNLQDIRFWRTQKKHEVDFVIQRERAFEVKFSENQFKENKYQYFRNLYPGISLQLIHFDNANTLRL